MLWRATREVHDCFFFLVICFYDLLVANTFTNPNGQCFNCVLCFWDLLITSTLTLRTIKPQWWIKREKMWNTLNFPNLHNKSKYKDMCGGVKCQCCLWGLWLVNVACEVYVLLMLPTRSKSLSMCQCYYLTMCMCPLSSLSFWGQCWDGDFCWGFLFANS